MSTGNPWKILKSDQIYDNAWIKLTEHQVINPAGGKGIYGEVHFKNLALGIVVLDTNYDTWLVGQYRFPLKAYSWEIPEGGGALNTDPVVSAKRELKEETGIVAAAFTEIQRIHLSNSVSDEYAIIFVAQDLQMGVSSPEETEELAVRKLPFEEAYQMVMDGTITDSMSVAGILKTKLLIDQGKI
ncbi:MAG: NUDIX hydrolase [Chitinophagaceae bacterium]|nr:MAG: NUDIX hydrolase [Chitinophagaceae bacterium]